MKDRAESECPARDGDAAPTCKFRKARNAGSRAGSIDVEALFRALEARNRSRTGAEAPAPAPATGGVELAAVLPFRRRG